MLPNDPRDGSRSRCTPVCAGPDVLTIAEAARRLRIGRNTAYEAARRGELPVVRIGRRLLVPRLALERVLGGDRDEGRTQHYHDASVRPYDRAPGAPHAEGLRKGPYQDEYIPRRR
jgi:excisionase family DNA binding protein